MARTCPTEYKKQRNERRRIQKANKYRLEHFEADTGRKRHNNMDNADATVIHLLYDAKLITQAQMSAALDYEEGYWHFIGEIFNIQKKVNFAKQSGGGAIGLPASCMDEVSERREKAFKKVDARIQSDAIRSAVHAVVLDHKKPGFYIKHMKRQKNTFDDLKQMNLLFQGLNAMIGK